MNMSYQIFGDLPPTTLSTDELRKLMVSVFAANPGSYYFTSFINHLSSIIVKEGNGFNAAPNTTYTGTVCQTDQTRICEIIWDMIIDRHLTIGGNGHYEWPNFSVTERGKIYFANANKK